MKKKKVELPPTTSMSIAQLRKLGVKAVKLPPAPPRPEVKIDKNIVSVLNLRDSGRGRR